MKHSIHNREGLPQEFQTLLADYPREAWFDHPHFAQSIQNWMGTRKYCKWMGSFATLGTQGSLDNK